MNYKKLKFSKDGSLDLNYYFNKKYLDEIAYEYADNLTPLIIRIIDEGLVLPEDLKQILSKISVILGKIV